MLLGEIVPHDGSCLVTDLLELRNHRIYPALVTFSCLFENGEDLGVFGIVGAIPWGECQLDGCKFMAFTHLGWAIPSHAWSVAVLPTNSKTPA